MGIGASEATDAAMNADERAIEIEERAAGVSTDEGPVRVNGGLLDLLDAPESDN